MHGRSAVNWPASAPCCALARARVMRLCWCARATHSTTARAVHPARMQAMNTAARRSGEGRWGYSTGFGWGQWAHCAGGSAGGSCSGGGGGGPSHSREPDRLNPPPPSGAGMGALPSPGAGAGAPAAGFVIPLSPALLFRQRSQRKRSGAISEAHKHSRAIIHQCT